MGRPARCRMCVGECRPRKKVEEKVVSASEEKQTTWRRPSETHSRRWRTMRQDSLGSSAEVRVMLMMWMTTHRGANK